MGQRKKALRGRHTGKCTGNCIGKHTAWAAETGARKFSNVSIFHPQKCSKLPTFWPRNISTGRSCPYLPLKLDFFAPPKCNTKRGECLLFCWRTPCCGGFPFNRAFSVHLFGCICYACYLLSHFRILDSLLGTKEVNNPNPAMRGLAVTNMTPSHTSCVCLGIENAKTNNYAEAITRGLAIQKSKPTSTTFFLQVRGQPTKNKVPRPPLAQAPARSGK